MKIRSENPISKPQVPHFYRLCRAEIPAQRSFSTVKANEVLHAVTISQESLNRLALIFIERDIFIERELVRQIDYDTLVRRFMKKKKKKIM